MDKYLTSTLRLLDDDNPVTSTPSPNQEEFVVGFLGHSSSSQWNKETIADCVMNPLISEIGLPKSMILSTEGTTSVLLQIWAERHKTSSCQYEASWIRMGKQARSIRDARIIKEANCLVFFLGNRSDYYEKIAIREVKKNKKVYTVDPTTKELVLWEL